MAYADTHNSIGTYLIEPVARLPRKLFGALMHLAENNSRLKLAHALNAMSDEDLAARGLRRENIGQHVWGDMFYL